MKQSSSFNKRHAQILAMLACAVLLVVNLVIAGGGKDSSGGESQASHQNQASEDIIADNTLRAIVAEPAYAVYLGDTVTPALELVPPTAETSLSFESLSPETAAVDASGNISGMAEGRAVINVYGAQDVSASFEIVVKKKMPDPAKDYPPLYDEKLQIVNAWNSLSEDYEPEVVPAEKYAPVKAPSLSMTQEALEEYTRMYNDCKAATGKDVLLITGYRSYSTQQYIHNQSVEKYKKQGYSTADAKKLASESVQPPGNSEHQLGVSIDIGDTLSVSGSFHKTKVGAWVTEHAHEYGWILRYPSDKTEITGISYEPWHFRYVGKGHAEYIYTHNICLEEYVALQEEAARNAIEYSKDHPATCD